MESPQRVRQKIASLEKELMRLRETLASQASERDPFEVCRTEAGQIARHMDDWEALHESMPFAGPRPLTLLFLGGVSGEWAAQSRYRGVLPGFGGFLLIAEGMRILIDPGRSTLSNLHAAGIHPRSLDAVIATHAHWDCIRDLPVVVMAASNTHLESARVRAAGLHLYAPDSVLYGHPMDVGAVVQDTYFKEHENVEALRAHLDSFQTSNAPALNPYDLIVRLGERFTSLEIDKCYPLQPQFDLYTRRSYHRETFGVDAIPALDFVVRRDGAPIARCVYLSDTEYRRELADIYARDQEQLGPIDVLICNVKTLDRPIRLTPQHTIACRSLAIAGHRGRAKSETRPWVYGGG